VAEAQTFKNCAAVKAKYPNGVAINFGVIGTSGAEINRAIYLRNQRLDRDKDGLICEDELKQNSTTTTTKTTTTTTTLSTGQFAGRYGSSLVSVFCDFDGSQGSGVVVPIQLADQEILEYQRGFSTPTYSVIMTNHHVIEGCLKPRQILNQPVCYRPYPAVVPCPTGRWFNQSVVISNPGEPNMRKIAYVVSFDASTDLAVIYSPVILGRAAVSYFLSNVVTRPVIGETVFAIGSAAGNPGTTTRGEVANLSSSEILSTAQAAPGSSGGALFNSSGQLLGIVTGARGTLLVAIPITRFCAVLTWVPVSSCAWKS